MSNIFVCKNKMSDPPRLETCSNLRAEVYESYKVFTGNLTRTSLFDHTSVVVGNRVYVLGGYTGANARSDAVYVLDPVTLAWSLLEGADAIPFFNNLAMLVGDSIYLICGSSPMYHNRGLQRTWRFDLITLKLEACPCAGNKLAPTRKATGQYIDALGEIIVLASNSELLKAFRVESKTWRKVVTQGGPPGRLDGLTSCLHGRSDMYIIGVNSEGETVVYLLRCSPGRFIWQQPVWSPIFPGMRYSEMICVGNRVFVTGGIAENGKEMIDVEIYELSESSSGNSTPVMEGQGRQLRPRGYPKRVSRHSLVCADNKLILIGGLTSDYWFLQVILPYNKIY